MVCEVLKTGSTGNCVLLNETIAFDMGIPFRTIKPYAKQLSLVLISHVHS